MKTQGLATFVALLILNAGCTDDEGSVRKSPDAAAEGAVDGGIPDGSPPSDAKIADAFMNVASDALAPDAAAPSDGASVDAAGPTGPQVARFGAASGKLPQASCPAWDLIDDAVPEDPRIENGHYVIETSDNPERIFYIQQAPLVLTPATLVIEARVKLVSTSSTTSARSAASFGFTIGDRHWKNSLSFEQNKVFLLTSENVRGPEAMADTTDAFHTYRLTADTTSGAITVTRDGAVVLMGSAFVDPEVTVNRVFFGEGSLLAHGASQWEYLEHNAANLAACPSGL